MTDRLVLLLPKNSFKKITDKVSIAGNTKKIIFFHTELCYLVNGIVTFGKHFTAILKR